MAYTIFDWAKEVTERKGNWKDISEEDKMSFNPFMLNRVLSMNQNYIELVAYVQRFWLLSHEQLFNVYKQLLPKEKVWSRYIKGTKDKANEEILKVIAKYYEISTREAKQYLKFLTKEEQIKIFESFGTPEEEIDKIYGRKQRSESAKRVNAEQQKSTGNISGGEYGGVEKKKRGRPSKKV